MFESVNPPAPPRRQQIVTIAASILAHMAVVTVVLVLPLLYFAEQLPEPPDMIAFVAEAPPPPPPPPPPAPAPRQQAQPKKPASVQQPVAQPVTRPAAAPVEAPAEISAPPPLPDVPVRELAGIEGGVAGGIAGGVAGGVMPAPPPPAPPPPAQPIRVGGAIQEPRLVHRVNPEYPLLAVSARKEGTVILEATVSPEGEVRGVKVLRSEPLLDKAAMEAVKQWRYAPLILNGQAHPFILTVTVSFNLN